MMRKANPREVRHFVKGFDHYTGHIDKAGNPTDPAKAAGLTWGLLVAMDEAIAERLKVDPYAPRIACKPGCAGCCHVEVRVTAGEAAFLAHGAQECNVTPNPARLSAQAGAKAWTDVPPELRACAFLGADGRCQVYEYRPGACRKYFALDTPDACDTVKEYGAEVAVLAVPNAELIASALISRQESGPMATMFIKTLGQIQE
jgi:Fe-S-cluster containining protein